mmetsp:Transcript_38643/g.99216  ORF Transcript_38643/g.99216 Transcript_38643/m.99216 type:complete len:255 (+) Transcript_38643:466-1230(+)|eukprot:CAMPEP_0113892448 /NCGR_PEP_ID=MMETSP0780_2-20120614/15422_1 /TAXON_ID=652834 /ORGANISM="Palpitomonas bilix" /LENGTH=254 /DNA_ID=CAMNT_0000882387 /DNA_START=368 /DNA_END=1132 /DNA_ORIENTATION=- /assembly_acc=CAM_ASM_000599
MNSQSSLREQAKIEFGAKNYLASLELFNRIVEEFGGSSEELSTLVTNKSMCYGKLGSWEMAEREAQRALALNDRNLKAIYHYGKACIELGRFEDAEEAICRGKSLLAVNDRERKNWETTFVQLLRHCRKQAWTRDVSKSRARNDEARAVAVRLLDENSSNQQVRRIIETALRHFDVLEESKHVPEHLLCPILMEVFIDPVVIAKTGNSFERSALMKHVEGNGAFDPLSRVPFDVNHGIGTNIALRDACEHFLEQ